MQELGRVALQQADDAAQGFQTAGEVRIIGLLQRDPIEFLQGGAVSDGLSNEEIEDLIARRKQARADKNWAESDRIRDLLNEHKIILEDNAGGTTWRRG